ncbi:MAG: hypothetical protein JWM33_1498 [Caulobacteraceae bacterium]|nr:hypothetical protein [Caulobacteraceae bacterium]
MSNNRPPYLRPIEGGHGADTPGVDVLLGELITRYRTDRALEPAQLAQRLGLTVAQLEAYEAGTARLPASVLHALAEALGVPATAFFR